MADKRFELEIQTKADTSGAKQAEDALKQVESAANRAESASNQVSNPNTSRGFGGMLDSGPRPESAEEIQARADAEKRLADYVAQEAEKREKLKHALEDEAEARRRLEQRQEASRQALIEENEAQVQVQAATRTRVAAWGAAGAAIGLVANASINRLSEVAEKMAAADPEWAREWSLQLDAIRILKDPIGEFWETLSGGALKAVNSLIASQNQAKLMKERLDEMVESKKKADNAFRSKVIEDTAKRETAAINETTEALRRQHELEAATADANAAKDQAAVRSAKALNTGSAPEASASAAANQVQAKLDGVDRVLEQAATRAEAAQKTADSAASAATSIAQINGALSEEARDAADNATAKQAEADKAKLDLENQKAIAEQQKSAILAEADAQRDEVVGKMREKWTENTQEVLEQVDANSEEIAKLPRQLQDAIRLSYSSLSAALADGVIDEKEIGAVQGQIRSLKASMNSYFGVVAQGIEQLARENDAATAELQRTLSRLQQRSLTPTR